MRALALSLVVAVALWGCPGSVAGPTSDELDRAGEGAPPSTPASTPAEVPTSSPRVPVDWNGLTDYVGNVLVVR